MTKERYLELSYGASNLTQEEIDQGYHFCPDYDFDVIPCPDPFDVCTCDVNVLQLH